MLNGAAGIAHGIGGTGAGGGHGRVGAAQAILDRQVPLAALTIIFGTRNAETRSGPLLQQPVQLLFDFVQTADARTNDHAAAERIFLGKIEPALAHGVGAGDHGKLREAIDPLDFFGREIFFAGCPIENFAAEFDLESFGVEQLQQMNAALAAQNALPECLRLCRPSEVTAPKPVTTTRRFMAGRSYDCVFSMYSMA